MSLASYSFSYSHPLTLRLCHINFLSGSEGKDSNASQPLISARHDQGDGTEDDEVLEYRQSEQTSGLDPIPEHTVASRKVLQGVYMCT